MSPLQTTGRSLTFTALVLGGTLTSLIDIARWTTQQTRAHLDFIDNNLLTQVTKDPTRKGVLLDLILTNKEELVRD